MEKINKTKFKSLILKGITTQDLNSNYDYSHITNMNKLFKRCKLETIPLIDMSKVTNASSMFYGCDKLKEIPKLNLSKVVYLDNMFYGCSSLKTVPLFNLSNVEDMSGMFIGCTNLESIPKFNTKKVNDMNSTFYGCGKLKEFPSLNTRKVEDMISMFGDCGNLEVINDIDISSLVDYDGMVDNCKKLKTIQWDLFLKLNLKKSKFPNIPNNQFTMKDLFKKYGSHRINESRNLTFKEFIQNNKINKRKKKMKTFREFLKEGKEKVITAKLFFNAKSSETLYTKTDGYSYALNNDKSVFFTDDKKNAETLSVDGKPSSKNITYDIMEVNGVLGVYDTNLKMIEKYPNMKKFMADYDNLEVELENWEES